MKIKVIAINLLNQDMIIIKRKLHNNNVNRTLNEIRKEYPNKIKFIRYKVIDNENV